MRHKKTVRLDKTLLKRYRMRLGYTQNQLYQHFKASHIKIAIASIKRMEIGEEISLRIANEIAQFYGVTLESITAKSVEVFEDTDLFQDNIVSYHEEPIFCLLSIKLNDAALEVSPLIDILKAHNVELLSTSETNLIVRYKSQYSYRIINQLLFELLNQNRVKSNCLKSGCSMILLEDKGEDESGAFPAVERYLYELAHLHTTYLGEQLLVDKALYYSICRYFDLEITNAPSILNKKYCRLKPFAMQRYVGGALPIRTYQQLIEKHQQQKDSKLFMTVVGESGMGKSHWARYLMSELLQYVAPKEVMCIYSAPEFEAAMVSRIALFVAEVLNVSLNASFHDIKAKLACVNFSNEKIDHYSAALRLEQILSTHVDHDAPEHVYWGDVAIIKALIEYSKASVIVFDGTYPTYSYYTQVFAKAFSQSDCLKSLVITSLHDFNQAFSLPNIHLLQLNVPRLSYYEQTDLVKRWVDKELSQHQIDEIVANTNGNLLLLRQAVLESAGKSDTSDPLIYLARLKLKELPQKAFDLLGLLLTAQEIDREFTWQQMTDANPKALKVLRERGILNRVDEQDYITHESYTRAFIHGTSNSQILQYAREVMRYFETEEALSLTARLTIENTLYRVIGEHGKILNNFGRLYSLPTTEVIYGESDALFDSFNISLHQSVHALESLSASVRLSWLAVVFGEHSPITQTLHQQQSQKLIKKGQSKTPSNQFIQMILLLNGLEIKQYQKCHKELMLMSLSKEQLRMAKILKALAYSIQGQLRRSKVLCLSLIKELATKEGQQIENREDIMSMAYEVLMTTLIHQQDIENAEPFFQQIDTQLETTQQPVNQCLLLNAQLCYLFYREETLFDKAMRLYHIAAKQQQIHFQKIAMVFIDWERAFQENQGTKGANKSVERFIAHYKAIVVNQPLERFYPMFALMLAKLNQAQGHQWSKSTMLHLTQAIELCTQKGANVYLSRLHFCQAKEYHHQNNPHWLNVHQQKAMEFAATETEKQHLSDTLAQWLTHSEY